MPSVKALKLGQTPMPRSYRSTWNEDVTSRQLEIMRGSLLGDGTMWKTRNDNQVSYFSMTNAVEEYAAWMYSELQNLCTRPVLVRNRVRKSTRTTSYEVNTASHPIFRSWRKEWYPLGKKVVPSSVEEWLTPLAIAVWFMEDGYKFRDTLQKLKGYKKLYIGRTVSFSTDAYSEQDLWTLQKAFARRYGLTPYVVKPGHLRFDRDDSKMLVSLMRPYILDCYKYKIAIDQPDLVLDETEPSPVREGRTTARELPQSSGEKVQSDLHGNAQRRQK